jgi:hypothetical protein
MSIPLIYPLRTVDPRRVSVDHFPHRRIRMTIDHEPLEGVTPEMLLWWFRHIGGTMPYAGGVYPRYSVWHPLDHISWSLHREKPGGGVGEGSRFHIVETFGQDRRKLVDSVDRVEKLDRTGIRLVMRIAGAQAFQLEHTWSAGAGRTHYVSVFDLGFRSAIGSPVNAFLRSRVFRPDMDRAWIKHNVEEVGLLEHFLPGLYAADATNARQDGGHDVRQPVR